MRPQTHPATRSESVPAGLALGHDVSHPRHAPRGGGGRSLAAGETCVTELLVRASGFVIASRERRKAPMCTSCAWIRDPDRRESMPPTARG